MLICDKAYIEIKNRYVVPLAQYSVQYRSLKKNNIKEMIVDKFSSVEKKENGDILLRFDKDIIYKALLGEIQLFYIRHLMQKNDVKHICTNIEVSTNWNIVSFYYNAFFAASLVLRLGHRGNIFFDTDIKKRFQVLLSQTLGEVVSIESNQYYTVIDGRGSDERDRIDDGARILKLRKSIDNTHEIVWKLMNEFIEEMLFLSREHSDERMVLTSIKRINTILGSTYPSKMRNKVNYQPLYGIECLEKNIYPVNRKMSWIDFLLRADVSWDDENSVISAMYAYSQYIELLCNNLILEYYSMRGNENGVLKKINIK